MDSPLAIIERKDSFAIIHLNFPENSTSLSQEVVTISEAFNDVERQSDVRAIVLIRNNDGAFSGVTKIGKELAPAEAREVSEHRQGLCNQIESCRIPVIAAIDGIAAGVGFELTLACHLRIASADASFRFPETWLTPIPGDGGLQRLARAIGSDHLREIRQRGGIVSAKEALRIGLINRIAPESRLLIEAESLARLISTMAPLAIRACLEAVTRGIELPLAEGLALESKLFASLFPTNDVREGTSAFLEKRRPLFKGN